jgi:hypothetical protein
MTEPAALRAIVAQRAAALGELESPFSPDDMEAVSTALIRYIARTPQPRTVDSESGRALLADATRDLPGACRARQRWHRERLLVSVLFTLAACGDVHLTGGIRLSGVPRRRIVDPLDPDLRLPADFEAWQDAIVQRLGRATSIVEIAWEAITTLLLWGGPCGRDAFRLVWGLQRSDYDPSTGRLSFRRGGRVVLEWTAAPIQQLALWRLLHTRPITARWLFPRHLRAPAQAYLAWIEAVLPVPPESLHQMIATLARWMLEVYPGWLVALAAGRFRAPHRNAAGTLLTRGRRVKPHPPSPREKRLRADFRRCLIRWLPRRVSAHARADFLRAWEQLRGQRLLRLLMSSAPDTREAVRLGYLDRLTGVIRDLAQKAARSATVMQAWDLGCSALDEVGTDPEHVPEAVRASLLRYRPSTRRTLRRLLDRLAPAAAKAIPARLLHGPSDPPSYIPDHDASETLWQMVPDGRRHSKDTVRQYLDLLRVGCRKEEALDVLVGMIDPDGRAEMLVEGTKSRSARRRVPLWRHPDREAVSRLLAAVSEKRKDRSAPVLHGRGGSAVVRRRHPDRPHDVIIDSLDHGLLRASQAAGLPGTLNPHALRHASISLCLERGLPLEEISLMHGHAELSTTLEIYVHSAGRRQQILLAQALAHGRDVWLPLPWVARYFGVSRQAVYQRYRASDPAIRAAATLSPGALRKSWPRVTRYVAASRVAAAVRREAKKR